MIGEFPGIGGCPQDHEGGDIFAQLACGEPHDRGLDHGGMRGEDALNFGSIYGIAASLDNIVASAFEIKEASGVEAAVISGIEPAVA
jgi:hypothetical protein